MKALLLAAGYGSRLRPLTDFLPKPLCLFMGRAILDIAYRQVQAIPAIQGIAVNTHHLGPVIEAHIQKQADLYKQKPHLSHEPEILGTGGCLNPLRDWIGSESLLIFNGDIISDCPLPAFAQEHARQSPVASMVLLPFKEGTTAVYVRGDRIVSIGKAVADAEALTFGGIHILSPEFIAQVPRTGFLNIIDTYKQFLAAGHPILAFRHAGFWADLGTPADYLLAHQDFWKHPRKERLAEALGFDLRDFVWDEPSETLYTYPVPTIQPRFRRSFIFGPVQGTARLDQCIVYPQSILAADEATKVLTSQTCLSLV